MGQPACFYVTILTNMVIYVTFGNLSAQQTSSIFFNATCYITQSLAFFDCLFIYIYPPFFVSFKGNIIWTCAVSACYVSPSRIYFFCQKSGHRFLPLFSQLSRVLFSLKLLNKKYRPQCLFYQKQAFISLLSLAWGKSLLLCMCTHLTMRPFACANDSKIVRSRDAQCNT